MPTVVVDCVRPSRASGVNEIGRPCVKLVGMLAATARWGIVVLATLVAAGNGRGFAQFFQQLMETAWFFKVKSVMSDMDAGENYFFVAFRNIGMGLA